MIEESANKSNILIKSSIIINNDEFEEINSIKNIIIPELEKIVDDTYEPIIYEDKIIAKNKINKELHF